MLLFGLNRLLFIGASFSYNSRPCSHSQNRKTSKCSGLAFQNLLFECCSVRIALPDVPTKVRYPNAIIKLVKFDTYNIRVSVSNAASEKNRNGPIASQKPCARIWRPSFCSALGVSPTKVFLFSVFPSGSSPRSVQYNTPFSSSKSRSMTSGR